MKDPRVLTLIGASFLLLFNVLNFLVRRFAPPSTSFGEGLLDGAVGATLGIAAMTLLMAAWKKSRARI